MQIIIDGKPLETLIDEVDPADPDPDEIVRAFGHLANVLESLGLDISHIL
jgi:hypothetical protein